MADQARRSRETGSGNELRIFVRHQRNGPRSWDRGYVRLPSVAICLLTYPVAVLNFAWHPDIDIDNTIENHIARLENCLGHYATAKKEYRYQSVIAE